MKLKDKYPETEPQFDAFLNKYCNYDELTVPKLIGAELPLTKQPKYLNRQGSQALTQVSGYSHDIWAVRTGDVPIPSAVWLLGSSLIALVGLREKFKK